MEYRHQSRLRSSAGFINQSQLIGLGIVTVIVAILLLCCFSWKDIPQNHAVLKQDWKKGIDPVAYPGGRTYFFNRFTEDIIPIDMSGKVFVMNGESKDTHGEGRDTDLLEIVSADKQKIIFSISLQWHRDPTKLVKQYSQYPSNIEENLIRPNLIRIFRSNATVMNAIDLYSGQPQENLRREVEKGLQSPNEPLAEFGVVVDNFVIERPTFTDAKYVENIEARQRATTAESRFIAEQKSNQAEADAGRIKALKKQYEDIVAAETVAKQMVINQQAESDKATIQTKADAVNAVTRQEAESKKIVLQAEADASKQVALSESAKQAEINRAVGIEAIGKSEAEAQRLRLQAFSVPGSELYTRMEVSKSFAQALDKVRFYPANASFNTVAKDFDSGLSIMVSGQGTAPTAIK